MGRSEGDQRHHEEPLGPFELPETLAQFLRGQEYAVVTQASDQGTVFVVKSPARELATLGGHVPIHLRHELYQHPQAPVIRTVIRVYDRPENPLALETFINVEQEDQRRDFAALAEQDTLLLAFYDEHLTHRLTKAVGNGAQQTIGEILEQADRVRASIAPEQYDFDRAKAEVMQRTRL